MDESAATVPAAQVDAAEAARLKREARKARILGKGSDRLARITNTGRGEGASAYTDLSSSPVARTPTLTTSNEDDPLEVDVSTLAQPHTYGQQPTDPFARGPTQQGAMPQNPMEALMQMMQGGGGMGMGNGMDGNGEQGDPMAGLPPQLAAMMQQFGMGGPGAAAGGMPNVTAATTTLRKSGLERAFDFAQAAMVLLLAALAAKSSLFNSDHTGILPAAIASEKSTPSRSAMQRWARLGYQRPSPQEWSMHSAPSTLFSHSSASTFGVPFLSTVPLFWIFLSLEVLLQAVRIAVFSRKTPAPPSMLATLVSILPVPNLGLVVRLAGKYLALLNAFVNDLAVLVFVMGVSILWAGWQLGGPANLSSFTTHALHDEL